MFQVVAGVALAVLAPKAFGGAWAANRPPAAPPVAVWPAVMVRETEAPAASALAQPAQFPPAAFGGNLWITQGPAPTREAQVDVPPDNEVAGCIQSVAAHPTNANILYIAAVNGGIWRTLNATNARPTWTPLTDNLPSLSMGAIEFDPSDSTFRTLVAGSARLSSLAAIGGSRIGVLRTTDGGTTWSLLGTNLFANENLASVSARGNVLMAASDSAWGGGAGSGLFRSTDFGATWTRISGGTGTGLPAGPVSDLVGDRGNLNRFYAAVRTTGIFRSDNGGATWVNMTAGITGISSATDKIEMAVHSSGAGNAVYVTVINNGGLAGVFRSEDSGATWTEMDLPDVNPGFQGAVHFSITANPNDPNLVYIGGDRIDGPPFTGNLVRGDASQPLGSQFTPIMDANANGTTPHADSREMVFDANGNLIQTDDGGIYRRTDPTTDNGVWESVIGNLGVIEAHDAAYDSVAKVLMLGAQDNGTQVQSTNGSVVWEFINGGDGGDVAIDDTSTPGMSLRYGSSQNLGGFFQATYDANNLQIARTFPALLEIGGSPTLVPQFVTPIVLNKIDPMRIMFGGANAAYESLDAGDTIAALTPLSGVNSVVNGGALAYGGRLTGVPVPDVVYYGSGSTVRLRVAAGGAVTQTAPLPAGAGFVRALVLDTNDWRRVFVIDPDQVFFSSNAGTNWSDITGNLSGFGSLRSLEFVPLNGTNALVVGSDRGVFCSFESSLGTWLRVGANLPNAPVFDLVYSVRDDVLFACTLGRGVFKLGPPQNGADLSVTLTDSPDPVDAGQNLVYTATVRNIGPNIATGVTLTDVLPAGVIFVSAGASQGTVNQSAGVVSVQLGILPAGATATVTIVVKPSIIGTLNNSVVVAANEFDPDLANNTAQADTMVNPPAVSSDLQQTLSAAPDPVIAGQPITYTAVITNAGPDAATAVLWNDPLPAGTSFVSGSASQGTVSLGAGVVVASLGNLPAGAGATVTVVLRPSVAGLLTNSTVVFGNEFDPNVTNNTATTITTVVQPLVLISAAGAILTGESFSPPDGAIEVGETVTVQFALQNQGMTGTSNAVATLISGNGVINPSGAQNYGVIAPGSNVSRPFSFTATNVPGGVIGARLVVQDSNTFLGLFTYNFGLGASQSGTNVTTITINDHAAATPYPSTINLSGVPGTINKVTVSLTKFNHTFPDDVDILLVGPAGQKVMLLSDAGGNQSVANLFLTFDDNASALAPNTAALTSGTFKPTDYEPGDAFPAPSPAGPYATSLSAFNGSDANGAWSLYVVDDATGDAGQISGGWSLTVQTVLIVNPPGDLGAGLSAQPSPATAGVPLIYTLSVTNSSTNTANGIVLTDTLPPGVSVLTISPSQGTATNIGSVVTCNVGSLAGGASASVTLTVVPSAPGTLTNAVTAFASQSELTPANNSASVATVINPPLPQLVAAGATLVSESFNPPNGGLDTGELVTLRLALQNIGTANTTNLMGTLLASGGVTAPGAPQTYGRLVGGGAAVGTNFTFMVDAASGGVVTATLELKDGNLNLGQVSFTFAVSASNGFSSAAQIAINPLGVASPYPATINVSGFSGLVSRVTVTLSNFSHTFPDEVDILLVGPTGEQVVLMSDAGGSTPSGNVTLTFDDAAPSAVPDNGPLTAGTYRAADYETGDNLVGQEFPSPAPPGVRGTQLAVFNGTTPNGAWSLYVVDDTAGDGGMIAGGWKLGFQTVAPVNPVADLSITAVGGPNPVVNGALLDYTVSVSNRGPATATSVQVTNQLPAGALLTFKRASQGTVQQLGETVYAELGSLASGAVATVDLSVYPVFSGTATNMAGVAASEADFAPGNNTAIVLLSVTPAPLSALSDPKPATGGTFEFMLNGQPGLRYVIEYSSNFVVWSSLSTNMPAGGKIVVNDPGATAAPVRFYRARQLTQ